MPFPKLSPLQSRFAASLVASIILLLLYLTLTKPSFAYAIELDSRIPPDHNHPIVLDEDVDQDFEGSKNVGSHLETELLKRQTAGVASSLANNAPQNKIITPGETQNWVFTKEVINGPHGVKGKGLPSDSQSDVEDESKRELRKRQSGTNIYITINACEQPIPKTADQSSDESIPPQLQLFLSRSEDNRTPGAGSVGSQERIDVEGGFAKINITADEDVYVGVSAPNVTNFEGGWNYEIAASNDAPYHDIVDKPNLLFVDGDSHAALLVTPDLTDALPNETVYQDWMAMKPPFGVFAQDQKNRSILGLSKSYCGLLNNAKVVANLQNVNNLNVADMTTRGLTKKPKEQFYINPLNTSSTYWGFLAMQGNSTASGSGVVGGGGKVWAAMNFTTKAESNCALMYNLTFCNEVAYAVPTNPDKYDPRTGVPQLAAIYDSHAAQMYKYFDYSLQQIPCNTTASAQYSLVRNCDDCAQSYKQWLCAVTIPRCEDWNNPAPWLKERNMAQNFVNGTVPSWINDQSQQTLMDATATNSSRNSIIDTTIQPGPYKEVLPCIDLCYDLVQSCPAMFGFGCPTGSIMNESYGYRSNDPGQITCSYLGAAYYLNSAMRVSGVQHILLTAWVLCLSWLLTFV